MSIRGRRHKTKANLSEVVSDSELGYSLRSSKKGIMSVTASKEAKSEFAELKEMLTKQNVYMESQFMEVKEKVNLTDDKVSAITENLAGVQTQVGQLTEKQQSADEKIVTLEAKLAYSDRVIEQMEATLTKNQSSIEELFEKATANEQAMLRLKFLEEFRLISLKKDEDSEQHYRKMNLWIYGLPEIEDKENTWKRARWLLMEVLELEEQIVDRMDIKNIHRVGS